MWRLDLGCKSCFSKGKLEIFLLGEVLKGSNRQRRWVILDHVKKGFMTGMLVLQDDELCAVVGKGLPSNSAYKGNVLEEPSDNELEEPELQRTYWCISCGC